MKKRPGGTTHLSISLPTAEAKLLKGRARRVYGGNVSRVVSDAIRYIAYEEGRDALIASFGGKGHPTPEEARKLDVEWASPQRSRSDLRSHHVRQRTLFATADS